jgi:glycosyltransferase involved in cell wall biosynthesis
VVNSSDLKGGAARATYRIHQAMLCAGVDSRMWVNDSRSGDASVEAPKNLAQRLQARLRPALIRRISKLLYQSGAGMHSPALIPSSWVDRINSSDADLVHLHWANDEMLSIADIGRIRKPIVWTLHDMWAFCGAEHYTEGNRWEDGYDRFNRNPGEWGFDLNRWVWSRKYKSWQTPMQIVTPSRWLAECARRSRLMNSWPITVVPNAIDTESWKPHDKLSARKRFGLPLDPPLLLFGAFGGTVDRRKGFDLLVQGLQKLRQLLPDLQLVVFGQQAPVSRIDIGFPVHFLGHLESELFLRDLYCAADLLAIPSRQDNLPNTGVEALACGTPVVAFDACGLPDVVQHKQTGYLARAFDPEDLANGIQWVLTDPQRYACLSSAARQYALTKFSSPVVARQYLRVYKEAVKGYGLTAEAAAPLIGCL